MRKKYLIGALALVLIVSGIGSSIAYFTSKDSKNNTFTVGDVSIEIDEPNWDPTDPVIQADAQIPKDPLVKNTGKNSAFIRLHVKVSDYAVLKDSINGEPDTLFVGHDASQWLPAGEPVVEEDSITYSYYYFEPLTGGSQTTPVFTAIHFPDTMDQVKVQEVDGELIITVSADAIQVVEGYSTAAEAFEAFDVQP